MAEKASRWAFLILQSDRALPASPPRQPWPGYRRFHTREPAVVASCQNAGLRGSLPAVATVEIDFHENLNPPPILGVGDGNTLASERFQSPINIWVAAEMDTEVNSCWRRPLKIRSLSVEDRLAMRKNAEAEVSRTAVSRTKTRMSGYVSYVTPEINE